MNALTVLFSIAGLTVFIYAVKKLRLRYALLSALSGMAAFFAADFICSFIGTALPLNAFSLAVSALGGIPGVILLNLLMALMK